jgi:hypothetical protein
MTPEELATFDGPDAPEVEATEDMWRRVIPKWIVSDDRHPGGSRVSAAAFEESKDPSPCSLIRSTESTVEQVRKSPDNSVGAIYASAVRAQRFKLVRHDDPNEPGHFHMVGPNEKNRGAHKKVRHRLADELRWVAGGPRWGPGVPAPPGQ